MDDLDAVAPAFVEMAHRIVWCSVATVAPDGRPWTRVLHPYWEWDGAELVGWIATSPTPLKLRHLAASPFVSCSYWEPAHDTCSAECRAEWVEPDERARVWQSVRRRTRARRLRPDDRARVEGRARAPTAFAALRLRPWRLRVMPGSAMLDGQGRVLTWSAAHDMSELARQLVDGDRRALARAITLVESTRADHRDEAEALLSEVLPHTGNAIRIGISGAPGAGKSTFIEALGLHVVAEGHRVAVLAVDPSSTRSGGSILGDKTRMEQLTRSPDAFVRPSPTRGTLGGVARRTREALLLCEAAGFDTVLVETVGVGQSEVAVAAMVDMFLVLVAPAGGDELQGLKRGIMELADLVVVNKADGDLAAAAAATASDYASALHLLRPRTAEWFARVVTCSALDGSGVREVWAAVEEFRSRVRRRAAAAARGAGARLAVVGDHRVAHRRPARRPRGRRSRAAARVRGRRGHDHTDRGRPHDPRRVPRLGHDR